MTRKEKQQARGYIAPPNAPRGEMRESRFRPLTVRPDEWRRRHAKAINRNHPAALA